MNIKNFQSDKEGEYTSKEFLQHTKSKGTVQRFLVHEVHGQNGVPERAHYTLLDGVQALLSASGLPASLWGEALKHMVWIRNQSPTKALDGMMPYEALYSEKPTLKGVREWGSLCWITRKFSKIWERAEEGRWIGFDNSSKGHRIYWPTRRSISVEHGVNFTPAPDPLLIEGEVGEVYLDFDALYKISDPPVKTDVKEPAKVFDQGDQTAVETQNSDKHLTKAPQPEVHEQPIPTSLPHDNAPAVTAPVRRPWYQAYHDTSNILESRL